MSTPSNSKKPNTSSFLQSLQSNLKSGQSPQLQNILNPITHSTSNYYVNGPATAADSQSDDDEDADWEIVDQDEDETEDENDASSSGDEDYEPEQQHEEAQEDVDLSFYEEDADYNELEGADLEKLLEDLKNDFDSSLLDLLKPVGYNLPQEIIAQQAQVQAQQESSKPSNKQQQHNSMPELTSLATIDPQIVQTTKEERQNAQQERLKAIMNYQNLYEESNQIQKDAVTSSLTHKIHNERIVNGKILLPPKSLTKHIEKYLTTPITGIVPEIIQLPPLKNVRRSIAIQTDSPDSTNLPNQISSVPSSNATTTVITTPISGTTIIRTKLKPMPYPNDLPPRRIPHNAGKTSKDIGIEEKCVICLRVFRGPKARTHRQQHIKNIHPESYTRNKSGRRMGKVHRFLQGPSLRGG